MGDVMDSVVFELSWLVSCLWDIGSRIMSDFLRVSAYCLAIIWPNFGPNEVLYMMLITKSFTWCW